MLRSFLSPFSRFSDDSQLCHSCVSTQQSMPGQPNKQNCLIRTPRPKETCMTAQPLFNDALGGSPPPSDRFHLYCDEMAAMATTIRSFGATSKSHSLPSHPKAYISVNALVISDPHLLRPCYPVWVSQACLLMNTAVAA